MFHSPYLQLSDDDKISWLIQENKELRTRIHNADNNFSELSENYMNIAKDYAAALHKLSEITCKTEGNE